MKVNDACWVKDIMSNTHRVEEKPFTHICQYDGEIYPSCFAIYARIISENEDSVTIDRFSKWGAVHIGKLTLSRENFEEYYKEMK